MDASPGILGDDAKFRFQLFILVTRTGEYCKNLDPDLTSEYCHYNLNSPYYSGGHLTFFYDLTGFKLFKNR
jgi:hypothetical protein